jgi:hypothetical protein
MTAISSFNINDIQDEVNNIKTDFSNNMDSLNLKIINKDVRFTKEKDYINNNIDIIKKYDSLLNSKIESLQIDIENFETELNQNLPPSLKYDGTANILKNNFKTLYNKQYSTNVNLFIGLLVVTGCIIKLSFYQTITTPEVKPAVFSKIV